jgi:hypothetical protein
MSMKNSKDIIGNRTHDLPACSAVPQPIAPPRSSAFCCISGNEPTRPIEVHGFCGQLLEKDCVPRKHS